MLALSLPPAVLEAERGRSMASPSQSGSAAPALYTRAAQILNMSQKLLRLTLDVLQRSLTCLDRSLDFALLT
jgi:hypothetical protein